MTPKTQNEQKVMDFTQWIKEFCHSYKFDHENEKTIEQIGLWANRSEKFNSPELGWHIDRGLLLMGVPGVGKDEIFRMLRKYMSYIGSPYGYGHRVVWQYAKEFQKDKVGYSCFDGDKGNLYYEELALTDEFTGELSRENVQHYGNKLLIGREIIQIRYNHFKDRAWQTHFSTNCNEDDLEKVYGGRSMDRLYEMCNFIAVPGKSKRGKLPPSFNQNSNKAIPPAPRETTIDEHKENKKLLELEYQDYLISGVYTPKTPISFHLLRSYYCPIGDDEQMRLLQELVEPLYQAPIEARVNKAEHKERWIWAEAQRQAVKDYYHSLKEKGAKAIFEEKEYPITDVVNKLLSK